MSENPKVPAGEPAVSSVIGSPAIPVVNSSASVKKETLKGDNFAEKKRKKYDKNK